LRIGGATFVLVCLSIFVISALPLLLAVGAGTVAGWYGCIVNEGMSNPCIIGGVDYGDTFYTFFGLGWIGLVTIPLGLVAALFWMVIFAITRACAVDRSRASNP
jgi:hypothetical protein